MATRETKFTRLFQALCLLAAMSVAAPAQQKEPPTLQELKARRFVVQMLDGKRVAMADLLGQGKPVVIDLWATWCGPCRLEIPHLNELYSQYRDRGLIMIGLTMENPSTSKQAVKDFAVDYSMNYLVGFAPSGFYQFFNPQAQTLRIPQTYVYGADGRLIRLLIGYNQKLGKELLEKAIAEAMSR